MSSTNGKPACYCIVRTDIPIADQMVQVGHACIEAGASFQHPENTILVLLQVENSDKLIETAARLKENGIKFHMFFEPDDNMGYTAIATESIGAERGKLFRRLQLVKH